MTIFISNLAIIIGINNYHHNIAQLKTAKPDAETLAHLLHTRYQYQVELITDDTDRKPTLTEIRTLVTEWLPQQLQPPAANNRLLFYFAGHGMPLESDDGPRGFLLPQDADPRDSSTFLPMQELHDALIALPCHHLLIILDCCFAGTFRWSSTRKAIPIPETVHRQHYDRFIRYPAWQVIASSAHNQEALDFLSDKRGISKKDAKHSPFAEALFEALQDGEPDEKGNRYKKADLTKDGVITAPELYLYLRDNVETRSGERQTPGLFPLKRHDRGEYIFHDPNFDPTTLSEAPELDEANNPYRGLKPFEEQHARFFFGRQELIEQLYARIAADDHALTVVLGVSGSGKSSLVKAGLIPHLRNDKTHQWQIPSPMRPGESPFASLARTLLEIVDMPIFPHLNQLDFLDKRLQRKHEQLNAEINQAISQGKENSSRTKQLQREAETFTRIIADWNDASPLVRQRSLVEHFEMLYALCQTAEQDSGQQQQLKQVLQECLAPLIQELQSDPGSLVAIAQEWAQNHPDQKLLLVIDQFEEFITLGRTTLQNSQSEQPEEWQQFLNLLETTLAADLPQFRIIVTLRSDFEPRFLNSEALKPYWSKARFPVRPMRSDELRQAIEEPASEMALYFEPANLVDRLIDEVGQMPGALPLLSFTLSELYVELAEKWRNQETSDRALTIDVEFDKEGGVAGSLTRRANEEYDKLVKEADAKDKYQGGFGKEEGKAYQATMRRIMLRMLTLEGGETARRRVPDSELIYPTQEESGRVKQVVNRLVSARLLVRGQLETGEPYVEPAHDFLVRGWGTLQDWIDEEKAKETLELQQRLTAQVNDWYRNNCPEGLLLPDGDRLKRLEKILNSAEYPFNQRETEFTNRSIQQARKLRARPELLRKADRIQSLLSIQPLEGLVLAIESIGQNLEAIQEAILSQVQFSLYKAVEIAREQIRFNARRQTVNRAAISWNGEYLLTHDGSSTFLQLWSSQGTLINGYKNQADDIVPVWECDGIRINYGAQSKDIALASNNLGNLSITSFTFSFKDKHIIVGDSNGVITFWDFQGKAIQRPFKAHSERISLLEAHPDIELIVSGSNDGFIGVWNYQGIPACKTFRAHAEMDHWTSKIAISPNGKYIASSHQEELKVWDLKGNLICEKKWNKDVQSKLIGFYSDDEILLQGVSLTRLKFQNQETNNVCQQYSFVIPEQYNKVIVDTSRELIIGITEQGNLALFDWNGFLVSQIPRIDNERMYYSLLFHPKHLSLLTITGKYLEPIKLWDLRGHQIIKPLRNHTGRISSIGFASNGQYIVSAGQSIYYPEDRRSEDKALYLWDTSGNLINTFRHDSGISSTVISKDNQLIASFDGSIWLWDFEGKLIHKFPGVIKGVEIRDAAIAFNQDNQNIVVAELNSGVTITVWDQQGNLISQSSQDHGRAAVTSVAISPNSEFILVGGDWTQIVNRDTTPVTELRGGHREPHTRIMSVAFSPDGCQVVTGGYDHSVQLWHCDGTPIGPAFTGHQGVVSTVAYSPDSNYIASGDWDGVIRLWDLQGNSIAEFQGHEGAVNALTFSPDGYTLVSGGNDGSLRLWRAHWKYWLELACDRLRYHPVFTNPESIKDPEQREIAIAACETCKKYVWNVEDETN